MSDISYQEGKPPQEAMLLDKLGVRIGNGDYVLVAHNGPYLNFGRVWRVQTSPRVTLEIQEVYQPENDPTKPFLVRLQSICSEHRVVHVLENQVPVMFRKMLEGADRNGSTAST